MTAPLTHSFTGTVNSMAPLILDADTVIFAAGGTLQSINMKSGKINWNFTSPGGFGTWMTLVDKTIYSGTGGNNVVAIDASKGT